MSEKAKELIEYTEASELTFLDYELDETEWKHLVKKLGVARRNILLFYAKYPWRYLYKPWYMDDLVTEVTILNHPEARAKAQQSRVRDPKCPRAILQKRIKSLLRLSTGEMYSHDRD